VQERIWAALSVQGAPLPGPHAAPTPAVLVAEDDPVIRELLQLMLEGLAFRAWSAADGLEAVEFYRQHRDAIGAVVLDIHMPRLDGPATLGALRDLDPQVGCVFITGDPGGYAETDLRALGAVAVLRKPFLPEDLRAALCRLPRFAGLGMTSRPDT
jgi:CheY-like chemotaxis protein